MKPGQQLILLHFLFILLISNIVAKDAVACKINYFTRDYKPITASSVKHTDSTTLSLYSASIARQTVAIDTFQQLNQQYMYDQLNRIHSAVCASIDPVYGTLTGLTDFKTKYSYDANGNLKTLVRYGNNTGSGAPIMDSLYYLYNPSGIDNKLLQVADSAPNAYGRIDIQYHPSPVPDWYQ